MMPKTAGRTALVAAGFLVPLCANAQAIDLTTCQGDPLALGFEQSVESLYLRVKHLGGRTYLSPVVPTFSLATASCERIFDVGHRSGCMKVTLDYPGTYLVEAASKEAPTAKLRISYVDVSRQQLTKRYAPYLGSHEFVVFIKPTARCREMDSVSGEQGDPPSSGTDPLKAVETAPDLAVRARTGEPVWIGFDRDVEHLEVKVSNPSRPEGTPKDHHFSVHRSPCNEHFDVLHDRGCHSIAFEQPGRYTLQVDSPDATAHRLSLLVLTKRQKRTFEATSTRDSTYVVHLAIERIDETE